MSGYSDGQTEKTKKRQKWGLHTYLHRTYHIKHWGNNSQKKQHHKENTDQVKTFESSCRNMQKWTPRRGFQAATKQFPFLKSISHSPSAHASKRMFSYSPSHPVLPHLPSIPIYWSFKHSQDQRSPFTLMPDKAILCYKCSWSYGSLHVYSLVDGLIPIGSIVIF